MSEISEEPSTHDQPLINPMQIMDNSNIEAGSNNSDDENVVAENVFYYKFDDEVQKHSEDSPKEVDGVPSFVEFTEKQLK